MIYSVNFGSVNLTSVDNGQFSSYKRVDHIKIHENYKPKVYYYDIAIATLSDDVGLSDSVSPICLPSSQELRMVTAHAKVTVTGWGHTSYGEFINMYLNKWQSFCILFAFSSNILTAFCKNL